jgi:hypothetical protein
MPARHSSAWRRWLRRSRQAQIAMAAFTAVAAAVAAVACIAFVDQHVGSVNQAAFSGCDAASASSVASMGTGPAAPSASAAPCPAQSDSASASPSATGTRVNVTASDFATGPIAAAQLGDVATAPVDGQGNKVNLNQTPAEAATSGNCTLVVPPSPLTAAGLAIPYQLADGCSMTNSAEQAFVEATILSPNGQVTIYDPLVITQGTTAAAKPAAPVISKGSVVIIDFGSNGTNLVLTGAGTRAKASGCVDADGQSVIGQVAACDAVPFYAKANAEITAGTLKVPAVGTSDDGQACETSRDFALIDQDQSDNTYSQYLLTAAGTTAQDTSANAATLTGASTLANGSDNALLGDFVDPANGCTAFKETDPTNPTGMQSSQALDELSARVNQKTQIAVVPVNDEMTLINAAFSIPKTNVYRSLVDQPQLAANTNPSQVAAAYCMNMVNIAPAHNQLDMARDAGTASPVPAVGNNLATFLGNRLSMSFANLGCAGFGLTDPVTVTADGNGVATAVTYTAAQQQATLTAAQAATAGSGPKAPTQGHGHGHKVQNPSGE